MIFFIVFWWIFTQIDHFVSSKGGDVFDMHCGVPSRGFPAMPLQLMDAIESRWSLSPLSLLL